MLLLSSGLLGMSRHYMARKSENNSQFVDITNKIILYLLIT